MVENTEQQLLCLYMSSQEVISVAQRRVKNVGGGMCWVSSTLV